MAQGWAVHMLNVFVPIVEYICPNCELYLCKLKKSICTNYKLHVHVFRMARGWAVRALAGQTHPSDPGSPA